MIVPTQAPLFWRKSSYSNSTSNCVEVAWHKSSFSNGQSNCVEVAFPGLSVATRDSKHPTGPTLSFPTPTWHTFLTTLTR